MIGTTLLAAFDLRRLPVDDCTLEIEARPE
jgi:hypothetical protein